MRAENGNHVPFLSVRNALDCFAGETGVFALCMIGQAFYKVSGTLAAPLWPSSGFALALLLVGGWRLFPAITFGTVAATQTFGDAPLFSLAGSLGNTLESLTGWYLMTRVFDFSDSMTRLRDVALLVFAGAPWGTLLSALVCTLGLVATGVVPPGNIPLSSLLFWTGNLLGILVFTPLVLRLAAVVREGTIPRLQRGDLAWTFLLVAVVVAGFSLNRGAHTGFIAVGYVSFPIVVWLSLVWRRNVTVALAIVTVLMTAFTATGHGPLIRYDPWATYAEMTVFIAVYALSCLVIMAAVEELDYQSALAAENRIAAARKETELQSIRSTLNPHFLFNSLNIIKSLVSENPDAARTAVVSLADLLRISLASTEQKLTPLSSELSLIRSYLGIQSLRMENHLEATFEIGASGNGEDDPAVGAARVPPMLFHQMVENAVKHSPPGVIKLLISARMEGDRLRLSVINPGHYGEKSPAGLGLSVLRSQIQALFGHEASFRIGNTPAGVEAVLSLPLITG